MRNHKYRAKLKLVIPEWGEHKKGDTEIFWFNLLDENMGLIRHGIDKRWDVVEWDEFIGLIDINKKDIYENDRVSFKTLSEFGSKSVRTFTGTIKWDEEDAGFYIDNDDEGYPHVKLWFATNIELIEK